MRALELATLREDFLMLQFVRSRRELDDYVYDLVSVLGFRVRCNLAVVGKSDARQHAQCDPNGNMRDAFHDASKLLKTRPFLTYCCAFAMPMLTIGCKLW